MGLAAICLLCSLQNVLLRLVMAVCYSARVFDVSVWTCVCTQSVAYNGLVEVLKLHNIHLPPAR